MRILNLFDSRTKLLINTEGLEVKRFLKTIAVENVRLKTFVVDAGFLQRMQLVPTPDALNLYMRANILMMNMMS